MTTAIASKPTVEVWPSPKGPSEDERLWELESLLPRIDGDFVGKSIIAMSQFSEADIDQVFQQAEQVLQNEREGRVVKNLSGKLIGRLFFEDSTRTDVSYRTAAGSAGAFVDGFNSTVGMSTNKNESDEDTVETYDQNFDLLVIRHPDKLFVPQMAAQTEHPVHNAGNGAWEHPTQALLDGFTILQRKGRIEGIRVTMFGDLLMGRTGHSLAQLLVMKGAEINFVAPPEVQMPEEVIDKLIAMGGRPFITDDINEVIEHTDVLYRMRTQKNRFTPAQFKSLAPKIAQVTTDLLLKAPHDISLLHPRPEDKDNPDFEPAIRRDLRYDVLFQTRMGRPVRQALMGLTLDRTL